MTKGACKELKERILNSEEYLSEQRRKDIEFHRREKIDKMRKEILSWFIGLPLGSYRIYGEEVIVGYKGFFNKTPVKRRKNWVVTVPQGFEIKFQRYSQKPTDQEIEWLYHNQEEVCKGIKFLYDN